MPADPITPGLAAAWSNTAPTVYGVASRFIAAVRAQGNQNLSSTMSATFDGVGMQGTAATVQNRAVLVTAQTTTSQNGIYVASNQGTSVNISSAFDAGGNKTHSGLVAGRLYFWGKQNGTSCTNGTQTLNENGLIVASPSGTLTFTGPASTGQTDFLNEAVLGRYSLFDAPNEFPLELVVAVTGGTSASTWWQLTSTVTTVGTSPVVFEQITVSSLDVGLEDNAWDNTAPDNRTPANATAFDNTGPGNKTPNNAAAFDNTGAENSFDPLLEAPFSMTNTPPDGKTPANAAAWDNTGATALVLQGEQPPFAGITTPASPTAADHTTTLVAGTNYLVQIGSRAAPVTITLPNPGSLAQRIEIADVSGQAATHAITVNGGTRDIETTGQTSYIIDRNDAVLALSYTGSKWKIL